MSNDTTPTESRSNNARDTAHVDAERRRRGLRQVLEHHGIRAAELAGRIGLSTANVFYNFLNGHSDSLSQRTVERILRAFPDTTTRELLIAVPPRHPGVLDAPLGYRAVPVMAEACARRIQPEAFLPAAARAVILVPRDMLTDETASGRAVHEDGAVFAVRVLAPGAEQLYPEGTVLICARVPVETRRLSQHSPVVVAVPLGSGVEVTARLARVHDRCTWLWLASSDPACQEPVMAPWHLPDGLDNGVRLLGRVIASWRPEPPTSRE